MPYDGKPAQLYRVRKTWQNVNSQIGAYSILANARDAADKAGSAYTVFDWNGKEVYRKAGQKVPYIVRVKKEMEIWKGPGTVMVRRTGNALPAFYDREGEERPGKAQEWGLVDPAKQDGEVVMK